MLKNQGELQPCTDERALAGNRTRFRRVFRWAGIGLAMVDRQRLLLDANPRFLEMTGFSSDAPPRAFDEMFHPDEAADGLEALRRILDNRCRFYQGEHRYRCGAESFSWGRVTLSAAESSKGRPRFCTLVLDDISSSSRVEDTLRKSEARYRALVENANDIIFTVNRRGRFTSANRAAEKITGYSSEQAIGMNLLDIVAPEHRRAVKDLLQSNPLAPASNLELEIFSSQGSRVRLDVSTRLIQGDDGEVWLEGVARDITERWQLEEKLRQSQKIEAVGRLAGGVAHDFNNLLTVIQGYAELLVHEVDAESVAREQVREIQSASERAAGLTRQLLAFARKQMLHPQVLDLNEVVSGVEKMLRRVVTENIDLIVELAPDIGKVKADPGQIEQVIMNLVVNAGDAMTEGGRLTIATANVVLNEDWSRRFADVRPGQYVMLSVSDTGSGMDRETLSRIFEPFFTTKLKGKGTGLGLATVYGIVKQSGGTIWAYSEKDRGSTFKIYLPATSDGEKAALAPSSALPLPGGSETILVVEDEAAVRQLTVRFLRSQGYKILTAKDGKEGLLIADNYPDDIHLLLTDVVMPNLGGRALADQILASRSRTKVLYMSGYTDDAIFNRGLRDTGRPLLQKPFSREELLSAVRDLLDS